MTMIPVLDRLADGPRAYEKWRLSSRASWLGVAKVLGIQLVAGLFMALAIRLVGGLPNNAVVNLITLGFAVGSALAGPVTMLIWSLLFFNLAGLMLGSIFGVWVNLPSWWRAAAEQWSAGTSIPPTIFLSMVGAFVVWVAASKGFAIGWGKLMLKLFELLRIRAKAGAVNREDVVRSSAAKAVLPSEAEARRAIAAVDSAAEDGIILRAPSLTAARPEPESPSAPLSVDDRSSIYEGLAGSSSDPLLRGLHKDVEPLPAATAEDNEVNAATEQPASPVTSPPSAEPSATPPIAPASRDRIQRQRRLETMVEIFIDRIHSEGAEQDVMQDFIRKNSAELLSFSAMDFEILEGIEGGSNLIEASKNARGEMPFSNPSIEKKVDSFAAAQMGAATFEFDTESDDILDGSDDDAANQPLIEEVSPGQEIAMGRRLTSLLKRATESEAAEAAAATPTGASKPENPIPLAQDNDAVMHDGESAHYGEGTAAMDSESVAQDSVGTSSSLMSEMLPDVEIVDSTLLLAPAGNVSPVYNPASAQPSVTFGGRFGEAVVVEDEDDDDDLVVTFGDGAPYRDSPGDIVTGSGTRVPQETSQAGPLPFVCDLKDDEMQDDLSNVPVPPQQAKDIFEILTTVHVASEQVAALRQLDTNYSYPASRAILSSDFVLRLGDQAAAHARNRFQHVREDYLSDPMKQLRDELDSITSRLKTILSRPIMVGDPRVLVIHGEVNACVEKVNSSPTKFADFFPDVQVIIDLLEDCLVYYRGDSSAISETPAQPPEPPAPLSRDDFNSTGDALSALAPGGMAERLSGHESPRAAHLQERFATISKTGPTAEELEASASQGLEDQLTHVTADDAATGTTKDGVIDDVDTEDYGFSDEELNGEDPEFKSDYKENSIAWRSDRQRHDEKIENLAKARRQRDARLAAEFSSLDDAVAPDTAERAKFHQEMEDRLNEVSKKEEEVNAAKAQLEKDVAAMIAQRDAIMADGRDLEHQKEAFEQQQKEFDAKASEAVVLDPLSQSMLAVASSMFSSATKLPVDLQSEKIISLAADFEAVKHIHRKMVGWSEDARRNRKGALSQIGLEEIAMDRLEPCSVAAKVLKVYGAYLANNLVRMFRDHLNLPPEMSAFDVVQKVEETYGNSDAIKTFTGNMSDYDDTRCNALFAISMEEQAKLAEYMKTPLSELRKINETLEEALNRASAAEAERDSLSASIDSYRSKVEKLERDLEHVERSGSAGASRSYGSSRSTDDIAESLGVPRSEHEFKGRVDVVDLLKSVKSAEVLEDWSAVAIDGTVVFHTLSATPEYLTIYVVKGDSAEVMPVDAAFRQINMRRPDLKSWFAVGVLSDLQRVVKDPDVLEQVVDANFDQIINRIVG